MPTYPEPGECATPTAAAAWLVKVTGGSKGGRQGLKQEEIREEGKGEVKREGEDKGYSVEAYQYSYVSDSEDPAPLKDCVDYQCSCMVHQNTTFSGRLSKKVQLETKLSGQEWLHRGEHASYLVDESSRTNDNFHRLQLLRIAIRYHGHTTGHTRHTHKY